MSSILRRLGRDERGGVMVVVIAFLPVIVGFAALVIDIGNGFTHRRQLQTQADAGAFAPASDFNGCAADPSAANIAIESRARDYALVHNKEVGGSAAGSVSAAINASDYGAADDSLGSPCSTGFVDVKLTNKDVPPFISLTGNQTVHAHARLQVFQLAKAKGMLPIAVEDPDPRAAKAIFVDETTGNVIASAPLKQNGTQNGLAIWDNATVPASVPVNTDHIGVRVALGGGSSTTCGDPLVDCYDAGSANGIVHIRGWSGAGTVTQNPPNGPQGAPLLRSVTLENGSTGGCADPYFNSAASNCTIAVTAVADFGGDPTNVGGKLTATVAGADYPMTFAAGAWTTQAISVAPGTGPVGVALSWEETKGKVGGDTCKSGGGNKCKGDFGTVQRDFGASEDRSGPIKLAQVLEGGSLWTNSLQRCSGVLASCTHSLVVKIGVKASFGLANATTVGAAVTQLRVVQGSQNQSLDCDPAASSLKDELAQGCAPSYRKNAGTPCPNTPSALWSTAQPWDCVGVQTGAATNQIAAGLNRRILGDDKPTSCTSPNNWSKFPNLPPGDPRLVNVIVTPFGSFSGNGSTTVPVTNMATFYITGWTGQGGGFANPCQGKGDDPAPDAATIVGHFYKYVEPNDGGASEESCDFGSLGTCVAELVQ